jgi:NAD(P)H-flavin reductase
MADLGRHYFVAVAAIYVPCYLFPWARTLFEYGRQKAQISVEENGFTRISIAADFDWQPGQHCFLRFTSFGINCLTSHPFTICSLPSETSASEIVFYIRHRRGLTARVHDYATKKAGALVPVLVDGPYGGIDADKLANSDRLVVIAGGAGAGWLLPLIEKFLRETSATRHERIDKLDLEKHGASPVTSQSLLQQRRRSLRVILATRDVATRTWFLKVVADLVSQYRPSAHANSDLHIEVHLTGAAEDILNSSSSSSNHDAEGTPDQIQATDGKDSAAAVDQDDSSLASREELRGRPDLLSVIQEEASAAEGKSVGVFACGPLSMQNDIRNAVAGVNLDIARGSGSVKEMYLHLEHFSWA